MDAAILSAHREVEVELLGVKLARLLKGIRIRKGVPLLAEEDDVVFFDEVGVAPKRIGVVRLAREEESADLVDGFWGQSDVARDVGAKANHRGSEFVAGEGDEGADLEFFAFIDSLTELFAQGEFPLFLGPHLVEDRFPLDGTQVRDDRFAQIAAGMLDLEDLALFRIRDAVFPVVRDEVVVGPG